MKDSKTCVICKQDILGWGNNPYPIKPKGQCCNDCNYLFVIPARLNQIAKGRAS